MLTLRRYVIIGVMSVPNSMSLKPSQRRLTRSDGLDSVVQCSPSLILQRKLKVGFDVLAAILIVIALLPAFAIIALLVSLDGGPAIFGHTRIGAGGSKFRCLKFRSMVTDGDLVLRRLLETDPTAVAEWAATQKLRNDPRVTRIGKILRATSLDEFAPTV